MRQILALLLLLCGVATVPAVAQAQIHRCVGADGNLVFTDQPCAALGATPLTRAQPSAPQRADPPPAVLCATSRAELKRAVIDAFVNHDANRIAGLMLWHGYGERAAVADIRALQRAMRAPLLDFGPATESGDAPTASESVDIFRPDRFSPDAASTTPPVIAPVADNTWLLRTGADDASGQRSAMRFTVVRRFGCWWLRSAD